MKAGQRPRAVTLSRRLITAYFLMFVLPVAYLLYLIADLYGQVEQLPSLTMLSLEIGIPAAVVMSLAAFALMLRSVSKISKATHTAETAVRELAGIPDEGPGGSDEAEHIAVFVSEMVRKLQQGISDVDRYAQGLTEANQKLVSMAINDGLTGMYNQKHIKQLLPAEMERAARFKRTLSILMIDIDNFKQFNDSFGHLAGDQAIKHVAAVIGQSTRRVDFSARYGGEEFLIVLPETAGAESISAGERIRSAVAASPVDTGQPHGMVPVTVSVGVAEVTSEDMTSENLIKLADLRLYQAKRTGKNRVCAG